MKKLIAAIMAIATIAITSLPALPLVPALADTNTVVETNHGWVSYHSRPALSSQVVGRLHLGQTAPLVEKANAYWYGIEVDGHEVYITTNSRYTHVAVNNSDSTPQTPPNVPATTNPTSSATVAPTTPAVSQTTIDGYPVASNQSPQQTAIVKTALSQVGVPWRYGTQIPNVGFDCSNFTSWVYKTALGIQFSSSSRTQRYSSSIGTPVPVPAGDKFANLQVGDLLFFANSADPNGGGHVGIYAGVVNRQHYIVQEGGGRAKVTYEPMEGTWFERGLVYARRILK